MSHSRIHGTTRLLALALIPSTAILARTIDTTPLPLCFDGIEEGTRFGIGDTFAMPGANVTVRAPAPVRGEKTAPGGDATIEGNSVPDATKAGVHLSIRNAAVEIEFTELVSIVVLHYRDPGKMLDLAVNGDGVVLAASDALPSSLGGVELRVPPPEGDSRSLLLLGVMASVRMGGDALTLDCGYGKGLLLLGAFSRGDADASGALDLSDPISILRFLFQATMGASTSRTRSSSSSTSSAGARRPRRRTASRARTPRRTSSIAGRSSGGEAKAEEGRKRGAGAGAGEGEGAGGGFQRERRRGQMSSDIVFGFSPLSSTIRSVIRRAAGMNAAL
jgi:hypothetical protein